jgi:S1-C subfamily serine protease
MTLSENYETVAPSVIAFISRFRRGRTEQLPLMPLIFGTGFLVHEDGIVVTNRHVAEVFAQIPAHPGTGEAGYAALLFDNGTNELGPFVKGMIAEVFAHTALGRFSATGPWHGESVPDIAFVQLKLKQTPFLKLAHHDFYVRPGTAIATVGFPMGDVALTIMGKVNQMSPFIRRGIVSSVFPSVVPIPHGFTIDVMQQGGSSGSPIVYEDQPVVVGMMAASAIEQIAVENDVASYVRVPTNISIAVPAQVINSALDSFRSEYEHQIDRSSFPTFAERRSEESIASGPTWDIVNPS